MDTGLLIIQVPKVENKYYLNQPAGCYLGDSVGAHFHLPPQVKNIEGGRGVITPINLFKKEPMTWNNCTNTF